VAIRNRKVHARVPIGGGPEHDAFLGEAKPPCVVVARTDKLQRRPIRLEPEDALSEAHLLPSHRATETGVTHDTPDPVVEAPAEIARRRVRVLGSPTFKKDPAFVGTIVAVGVS